LVKLIYWMSSSEFDIDERPGTILLWFGCIFDQLLDHTKFRMRNKENSVTLIDSGFSNERILLTRKDDWIVNIHWNEAISFQSPIWNGRRYD
jgi:hypothetical protein